MQAPEQAPRPWPLLDGMRPWGSFDAAVGRYGVRRYRLTLYPPGTSAADRLLARAWRGWPVNGVAMALLAVILLGDTVAPPGTVLEYAGITYLGVGALLFLRAGPGRVQVRGLLAILLPEAADGREDFLHVQWLTLVRMLTRADRDLAAGAISPVEHEAVWWDAYDRLGGLAHA